MRETLDSLIPADEAYAVESVQVSEETPEERAPEERTPGELLTSRQHVVLQRALSLDGALTIRRVSRGPSSASDVLFEAARVAPPTLVDPPFAPGWDLPSAPTQEVRLARLGAITFREETIDAAAAHAGARELVRRALQYRTELACRPPAEWTTLDEALLLTELDERWSYTALRQNLTALLELLRGVEQQQRARPRGWNRSRVRPAPTRTWTWQVREVPRSRSERWPRSGDRG